MITIRISKKLFHHIFDLLNALFYTYQVLLQYRLYSWADFPLGWDPVIYASAALRNLNSGFPFSLFMRGRFSLYALMLPIFGLFIDVCKVEAVLPVLLTIMYASLSSYLVYKSTRSNILAALSTFLTYYSIRNVYFTSMFHANLLAFIFIIYASIRMTKSFEETHKWILIMLTTVAYTHIFTFVFLGLSAFIYYIKDISNVIKYHFHNRKITIIIISLFSILLILNYKYIPFLYGGMVEKSNLGNNYWFHEANIGDYLMIYNNEWWALAIISLSTIYTYFESKEYPVLRLLSIFGIVSFIAPLLSIVFPGAIPPSRITLLNQYQVILPISVYLLANRISPKLNLPTIGNIDINKTQVISILFVLIFLVQAPETYKLYNFMFKVNMSPNISEDVYSSLKEVRTILEKNEYPTPVVVLYCQINFARIWSYYAYIALDNGYSYYGKYNDAMSLKSPSELTYLDHFQLIRAIELYEPIKSADIQKFERYTLVVIESFYSLDIEHEISYSDGIYTIIIEK